LPDFDALFTRIRARWDALPDGSDARADFAAHLASLARFLDEPMDYEDLTAVVFPAELPVAFAVCHPECGTAEFIVDGSTQECQRCGGSLFRTEVRMYALSPTASS
jgi:hypothetical protein